MLLSLFRKKSAEDKLYPTFNKRMFAAVIDLAIFSILLIPVTYMMTRIIYDGEPPSKQLSAIMARIFSKSHNLTDASQHMLVDAEYKEFMTDQGYTAIFVEQSLQLILLAIVILAFWLKKYATPGKMLLSLKIVDVETLSDPSAIQLIVRVVSYVLSLLPLGLGFLYILINKKRRAWHDLIAGTVVISKKHLT